MPSFLPTSPPSNLLFTTSIGVYDATNAGITTSINRSNTMHDTKMHQHRLYLKECIKVKPLLPPSRNHPMHIPTPKLQQQYYHVNTSQSSSIAHNHNKYPDDVNMDHPQKSVESINVNHLDCSTVNTTLTTKDPSIYESHIQDQSSCIDLDLIQIKKCQQ